MTNAIDNSQDVIDSRDIISRIEELEAEQQELMGDWDQLSELTAPQEFLEWEKENGEELDMLRKIAAQGEGYGDWAYGESLIRESYFTDYIEELINDCYEMPKAINSGEWPYRHMKMDYEAAAEEAKSDYMEIDFDGETYFMRA